jgi:hypothetical protein
VGEEMIGIIVGICLILVGLWMMWKGSCMLIEMSIEEHQNKITLPINACETCPNYGVRLRETHWTCTSGEVEAGEEI